MEQITITHKELGEKIIALGANLAPFDFGALKYKFNETYPEGLHVDFNDNVYHVKANHPIVPFVWKNYLTDETYLETFTRHPVATDVFRLTEGIDNLHKHPSSSASAMMATMYLPTGTGKFNVATTPHEKMKAGEKPEVAIREIETIAMTYNVFESRLCLIAEEVGSDNLNGYLNEVADRFPEGLLVNAEGKTVTVPNHHSVVIDMYRYFYQRKGRQTEFLARMAEYKEKHNNE